MAPARDHHVRGTTRRPDLPRRVHPRVEAARPPRRVEQRRMPPRATRATDQRGMARGRARDGRREVRVSRPRVRERVRLRRRVDEGDSVALEYGRCAVRTARPCHACAARAPPARRRGASREGDRASRRRRSEAASEREQRRAAPQHVNARGARGVRRRV